MQRLKVHRRRPLNLTDMIPRNERQRMELESDRLSMETDVTEWMEGANFRAMLWSVAGGETPKEWCERMGFPIAGVMRFIYSDESRKAEYDIAIDRCKEVMVHDLMATFWSVARADRMDLFGTDEETGKRVVMRDNDWPKDVRQSVEGFKLNPDGSLKEVTFVKKGTVMDQLAKSLGAHIEKREVKATGGLEKYLSSLADKRIADGTLVEGEARPIERGDQGDEGGEPQDNETSGVV